MIDWNYDGVVMQPTVTDVSDKKEIVSGVFMIFLKMQEPFELRLQTCYLSRWKWRLNNLWQKSSKAFVQDFAFYEQLWEYYSKNRGKYVQDTMT